MDAITQEEYDEELDKLADTLVSEIDEELSPQLVVEEAETDVQHHNWFARGYYDLTLYASIIEHAEYDREWSDWEVATDASNPVAVVKRLAYIAMENDLTGRALERLEG